MFRQKVKQKLFTVTGGVHLYCYTVIHIRYTVVQCSLKCQSRNLYNVEVSVCTAEMINYVSKFANGKYFDTHTYLQIDSTIKINLNERLRDLLLETKV